MNGGCNQQGLIRSAFIVDFRLVGVRINTLLHRERIAL